ncbi:class II fructose-bisphosphate aldolase [Alicyclobacillus macrosporangiidus]|uniref:class II fructose-bisphosphate aldolase n=1 Tax=Alicyclobacillus macrosporangiidus TaxID=392015 RepID=UPI00049561FA|nr:class II fructose-bisphosphate aldolase [Alicyclobacillus macrosporangiidus]
MPLATGAILRDAYEQHYAVPAFSVHSADMIEAVVAEANLQRMPIMLQIGQRAIRNGQMQTLVGAIQAVASQVSIPVVIHLDHSRQFEQIVQALRAGFTSCMIDASALSFEENIAETVQAVRVCHAVGVPVEGELGAIGGAEDDIDVRDEDVIYTSPEAAAEFIHRTGVDSLAVAIGSAHGMYKQEPKLDLERLGSIYAATNVPLVLHGGSGIPEDQIRRALKLGIAKINFDTELRLAYVAGLREGAEQYGDDPFTVVQYAQQRLREVVREKIRFCAG